MHAVFQQFWNRVRSSYWFIPSIMAVVAVLLSFFTIWLDTEVGGDWLDDIEWLYPNKPEGARAVLSTIAGSMITVAGTVFSVTIVAVTFASGQFGPRILTNFMRDTGNQVTLGTFIATFLYCLLVLRTVRNPEESDALAEADLTDPAGAFVPHIAVLVGIFLAICSIGVLIYFLHHVPERIHISNVIARIGRQLNRHIAKQFPHELGKGIPEEAPRPAADLPPNFFDRAASIDADGTGYIEAIDNRAIMRAAERDDLVLWMVRRPGDFVARKRTLVLAMPADRGFATLEEFEPEGRFEVRKETADNVRQAFAWGAQRTPLQDLVFLFDELVELASRALSTGVNDPFTAIYCLDWLGAALSNLAGRTAPDPFRFDDDGNLRVVVRSLLFEEAAGAGFARLRPYTSRDRNAGLHSFIVMSEIARSTTSESHRAVLRREADDLLDACRGAGHDEATLKEMTRQHNRVVRLLRDGADPREDLINQAPVAPGLPA